MPMREKKQGKRQAEPVKEKKCSIAIVSLQEKDSLAWRKGAGSIKKDKWMGQ